MSQRPVDPLFATTTPIRYRDVAGGGTGFFLNYNGETFLISNRHVVDPEDDSPSQARIWFRNHTDISQVNHHDISLADNNWYDHPVSEDIDLAVIPLNMSLSTLDDVDEGNHQTGSLAFTRQHFIHENEGVDNRVVILGYPGDFYDRSTLFPVQRNALIASPYGQPFNAMPYFVTDAKMHPGTSGSPVIYKPGVARTRHGDVPQERNKQFYIIGIHSATFYGTNGSENGSEDQLWDENQDASEEVSTKYELNVAWYPELLDDIIDPLIN